MGNCVSNPEQADAVISKQRSEDIDRQIQEDSRKFRKECKILLLGPGESGKSTIVKQMKILHQNGFSKEELMAYRSVIFRNVVDSAQTIVHAMQKLKLDCELPENRVNAERILDYRVNETGEYVLTSEVARAIHEFWGDGIVPKILEHSNEFYLMDNAPYFFGEVLRIGAPLYQPTERDVLRTRRKTTGITETRFEIGHLSIHMFDVGGQRSERRKWIHCFESVTTIIFCTALNEYDQVLLEDKTQNRMVESLVLFESVINSRWFLRSSIILFLNKIDLFKVKIPKVPLSRYFPEYTGGPDMNKAAKYILWRFMTLNRAHLSIYPHLIQATDTSSVRQVFGTLKETLLQNALKDSYIL